VLVHILGKIVTFYIVLLRVYPSTCARIFIGIGIYLTDSEHKIGWHSFFRHGVYVHRVHGVYVHRVRKKVSLCFLAITL